MENGISYRVLREVENDVLLSDSQQVPEGDAAAMDTDDSARVLSLVKKLEVEVLCPQHNPVSFIRLRLELMGCLFLY